MKAKNLVAILSLSLILAACGNTSNTDVSSNQGADILQSKTSKTSIDSSVSSLMSSSSKSSNNGVHNYQQDLEDISSLLKGVIGREKSFTINEDRELSLNKVTKVPNATGSNIKSRDESKELSKVTISHHGEDGTGYLKYDGEETKNDVRQNFVKTYAVENLGGNYKEYDFNNKEVHNVDSDYFYYARTSDSNIIEFSKLSKLTLSYFERFYSTIDDVRQFAGNDLASALSLKNFNSQEFIEENGIKKITFIYGTTSVYKGGKTPLSDRKDYKLVGGTFDCQYTLEVAWNDKEVIKISEVYGRSFTTSIADSNDNIEDYQDSIVDSQSASFRSGANPNPSFSKDGFKDCGNIDSNILFNVPLKNGTHEYANIKGLMDDQITNEMILGEELSSKGIAINVYSDANKTKKVDFSSLKFKSYNLSYYITFSVPKESVYVIIEQSLRFKSDVARGDLTFKSYTWTDEVLEPNTTWTPSIFKNHDNTEYQTTGIEVLVSSDTFARVNGKSLNIKGGNYYVVRNNADEI